MDETYEPEIKAITYGLLFAIPFIFVLQYLSQALMKILPDNIIGMILYLIAGVSFLFVYIILVFLVVSFIEIDHHLRKSEKDKGRELNK